MQDISFYFRPIQKEQDFKEGSIGHNIIIHEEGVFPEVEKGSVVLFHVNEFRNSTYENIAPEKFRTPFYELNIGVDWSRPLYDLGNIEAGNSIEDTYYAVSMVLHVLIKNDCIPVLVGGSQDLTFAMYKAFEQLEQTINLCTVDSKLDLGDPEGPMTADGYISHMLMQRPCYLFNHANIGVQAPLASAVDFDLFEKLLFDYCRLGEFNADFKKAEPFLRNSDVLSLDLSSLRYSELNDTQYYLPNGFYADQICQIAKYAGVSDKMSAFGIFNYLPEHSTANNISALVGQIIWYFIDGVSKRVGDFPIGLKKDYLKFHVHLEEFTDHLVFYKSNKSQRWWLEVPYTVGNAKKYERHHMVPCDQDDYEKAMRNELPDLWWKTYQKLV